MTSISIVIPTFNRAHLVCETIDAILAQTISPDEVIVVDDGSTDDTQVVLARYAPRITVIRNQNCGDLVSRNIGLRAAKGQLVAFCDSDDLWEPEFLEELSAFWRRSPEQNVVYTNFRELRNGSLASSSKFDDAPKDFWAGARTIAPGWHIFDKPIVARLLAFQPFFPSCMMVNRAAFQAIGGWDEAVSRIVGCDFATALRVSNTPPIGVIRQPLVRIRKHTGNISMNTEQMNIGDALVLEYAMKAYPELNQFHDVFQKSIIERRQHALNSAFSRQDFETVREINRLIPTHMRSLRQRTKVAVANLPRPLGKLLIEALSRSSITGQ